MSFPIVLNSTNYVSNNTYRINFPTAINLTDYECALGNLSVYYSWFNINAFPLNNNAFTLTMPSNATLNITIPDGAYNISNLNEYLQYRLIQAGYYITNNTTGLNTYYCAFILSPTSYSVQFITYPIPTSLPSGFTSGGMSFPASANQHQQLTILSTNNFKDLVGYNPGTYPAAATNVGTQVKNSDYTPNVQPISSLQLRVSCLSNPFSSNNQLLHVFTTRGVSFGQNIDGSPNFEQYVPCEGTHKELTVSFYDQLGNVVNILDRNLVIKLNFRKKITA
jgi:hypothetical protein